MTMISKEDVRIRLVEALDCKEKDADAIVEKLFALPEDIFTEFENWFTTGKTSEFSVEGYTVTAIMEKKKQINIIGAFLMLEWLRREPKKAAFALNEPTIINKFQRRK